MSEVRNRPTITVALTIIAEDGEPSPAYLAMWRRLLATPSAPPPPDQQDATQDAEPEGEVSR